MHADTRTALLSEREPAEIREQFIAVLGLDLRTPLTALPTNIDLTRLQEPSTKVARALNRIEASVGRMING